MPRKKKAKKIEETAEGTTPVEELRDAEATEAAAREAGGDGADAADAEAIPAGTTLEERLERAEREAASQSDRALRTLAEFDNYRRRVQRDLAGASDRGAAEVLGELLGVVDNFDRALEHAGSDVPETFVEGMRLVASGLHEILERRGVERIEAVGAPFDPELHEALTAIPSEDAEPNTVLQEVQTGWRLGDRILRAAKVVVARAVEVEKDS